MGYVREELEDAVGKRWAKRIVLAGTIIAIYLAVSFFTGIWPFSTAVGVVKKVTEPTAIIQNYEWFYNQYHAIQAQQRNVAAMPEGSVDRVGTQMVLNNMIAEYNARSRQITRNLWKSNELPYQIEE